MFQTRESMQLELDTLEQTIAELELIRDDLLEKVRMKQEDFRELRLVMEHIKWFEAENTPRIMELKKLLRNS